MAKQRQDKPEFVFDKTGVTTDHVSLWDILVSFVKIGVVIFGGGYAMLPIITRELAEKRGWVSEPWLLDTYAIGQVTPGVIAVTTAGMVGTVLRGVRGAVAATLGLCVPPAAIAMIVGGAYASFDDNVIVQHAFAGIRVAVCALVVFTVFRLAAQSVVDAATTILFLAAFVAVLSGASPVLTMLLVGAIGFIYQYARLRGNIGKSAEKDGGSETDTEDAP